MKKPLSKRRFALLCIPVFLLSVFILWIIWGNTAFMVSTAVIPGSRVPPEFSGFRIAQISDLHNAEFGEDNSALLETLSGCRPDLIAITGDLADSRHTDLSVALSFVRKAVQIAPVYYVPGNHEARLPQYPALKAGLRAAGAAVLEDEALSLSCQGGTITLIGLSDPSFASKDDLLYGVPAMTGAKLERLMDGTHGYTIVLSHRPELFEAYAACGADLVFTGHAHGGQFRLPLIGGLAAPNQGLFPKYDGGLYASGSTTMIVSRGLGNSIVPLRFCNRPELVLAELRAD